ncbi:PREDICTED: uncharacterized protein LOC107342904 [Paramuricea clavata]|uniref:PREDICTED: uncharacterized protein LOC107342904 n=1 Tax=Paramuricea clavata TaxID=317549 RepID=A0A7D9I3A9_PARCT|nr:PREDICTED: uncharacterized protein LOC107342904 [Paramuricea clavata]
MGDGNEHSIEELRKIRSTAKANVTRKINKLSELISNNNIQAVEETKNYLYETVNEFQLAHKAYHEKLENEVEKSNSSQYCAAVLEEAEKHKIKVHLWLSEQQKNDIEVRPDDSISNVSSLRSRKSKSSSVRSSASAKAKAAAKKAALEAKAASLQRLHELQFEELKLQQRKAEIELRGEIAVAEAERRVYEESEVEEMYSQVKKSTVSHEHSEKMNYVSTSSPAIESSKQHAQPNVPNLPLNDKLENPIPFNVPLDPKEWNNYHRNNQNRNNHHESFRDESFQMLKEAQDRQNTVLRQLIEQQQQGVMALTLPQPTMQIFNGDPTSYCDFVRAFEHLVERKTTSPSARLYYLVQYTSGHVQELMKSCLSMKPSEGYMEATRLLRERYGQSYQIASAHVNRLINGPVIKPDDGVELQRFSIQLTSCANTLKEIGCIGKLDNSENLKRIINRLPTAMRYKWRDAVDRIVEQERRDITINDVTKFVTSRARAANHPVFGKVERERKERIDPDQRRLRPSGIRANGFAIHGEEENQEGSTKRRTCPSCKQNHWLSRCERFRKQSLEDRQKFVKDEKLCNNCLLPGHYVRSCTKQSFCKVPECTGKHSTFLHPKSNTDSKKTDQQNKEEPKESGEESTAAHTAYIKMSVKPNISTRSSSATGLAIVPVRVKAKGGSASVETYAFLDSGSNTSFCTETLLKQLNVSGSRTNLSLTTIQGENVPAQCSLVSLEVSDLSAVNHVDLPVVYSRPSLPISPDAIGKEEDIHQRLKVLVTELHDDLIERNGNSHVSGQFEWVDGQLVKALKNGHWLLIDNVNFCSPSVLDRLNGLLEPGGVLSINERGVIDGEIPVVKPHPDFRLIFAMDSRHGEISRAMRNRGVEIFMMQEDCDTDDLCSMLYASGCRNSTAIQTLSNFHDQNKKGSLLQTIHTGSLMSELWQRGIELEKSLVMSMNHVYGQMCDLPQFMTEEQLVLEPSKLLKHKLKPTATSFQKDAIHAMITWHATPLEILIEDISKSPLRDVRIVINIFLEWCSKEDWRTRLDWLKSSLLPSRIGSDRFTSESEIADYCLQKLFESKVVKLLYDIYGKLEMNYIDCKFDASYQPVNVRVNGPLYKYISCKIHWDEEMSGQFTSYINRVYLLWTFLALEGEAESYLKFVDKEQLNTPLTPLTLSFAYMKRDMRSDMRSESLPHKGIAHIFPLLHSFQECMRYLLESSNLDFKDNVAYEIWVSLRQYKQFFDACTQCYSQDENYHVLFDIRWKFFSNETLGTICKFLNGHCCEISALGKLLSVKKCLDEMCSRDDELAVCRWKMIHDFEHPSVFVFEEMCLLWKHA